MNRSAALRSCISVPRPKRFARAALGILKQRIVLNFPDVEAILEPTFKEPYFVFAGDELNNALNEEQVKKEANLCSFFSYDVPFRF